jgi:hypothetical protein
MSAIFSRVDVEDTLRTALAAALADVARHATPIARYADELRDWDGWPHHCHAHVAFWLQGHHDDKAVHGWLLDAGDAHTALFRAHSLVRTSAGDLVDVAFNRPDGDQVFIEHPSAAGDFSALLRAPRPLIELCVPMPADLAIETESPDDSDPFFQTPLSDHSNLP